MPYEVELKFPLADSAAVRRELGELGAEAGGAVRQVDVYFNHPSRDFAETDEAFRVRTVGRVPGVRCQESAVRKQTAAGSQRATDNGQHDPRPSTLDSGRFHSVVTYKGPLVDETTKTRREIEVPLGGTAEEAAAFCEMLRLLGFRERRSVHKTRMPLSLEWEGRRFEVALDEVDGLGSFLEIETPAAEAELDAARESILRLAARLGLENSQRKSYLQLLLESDRA